MSMCDIIGIMKTWSDSDGAICAKLELQCSTVDDLPSIDDVVGGFKVKPGTISQLIQADTFVTLDYNGTWYPEQASPQNESPQLDLSPNAGLRSDAGITAQADEATEPKEETEEAKKPFFDLDGDF